jgi:hypothetical protein
MLLPHRSPALAKPSSACATLLSVPGVGLLTATAMVAATSGQVSHFRDARHFASWFGLTPKEHSSGATRHLGRISKRGERYLRMLLTHGARSVLHAATVAVRACSTVDSLRQCGCSPFRRVPITTSDLCLCQQARSHLLCDATRQSYRIRVAGRTVNEPC